MNTEIDLKNADPVEVITALVKQTNEYKRLLEAAYAEIDLKDRRITELERKARLQHAERLHVALVTDKVPHVEDLIEATWELVKAHGVGK